jgi:hypothetical protein
MTSAKCKFDWLKTKELWGAQSPDDKKIVAMTVTLNALKGQLKLDPTLSAIANEGKRKGDKKDKKKNKKNTYNQWEQKKDEDWKKELPWRGLCTSLPTASWASSTRKTRRRNHRKQLPTPLPLLLPLRRQ